MGAMISYVALAVNMLTGLIYTPWMVSKIGQSNYGIYALAISLISVFIKCRLPCVKPPVYALLIMLNSWTPEMVSLRISLEYSLKFSDLSDLEDPPRQFFLT